MTQKAEVVIAVESLSGGGAERVALDLARYWPADHALPTLLVASRRGAYAHCLPNDLHVVEVGVSSSPRHTISFLLRLHKLLKRRKLVGVISHMTGMNRMLLRAKAAGIVRAPVLVVEHNNFVMDNALISMPTWRRSALQAEISWLYHRADHVIGVSHGVTQQIQQIFGLDATELSTVLNPLTPSVQDVHCYDPSLAEEFQDLPRPWIVSVGRMEPQKCFGDLIKAFARLEAGSLILIGEGAERYELELLACSLGVETRVFMPGFIDTPGQLMRLADLYVSASAWEGLPLVLLEAYACGLPVVARDCDFGPAEILTPDRPGELVCSDSIEALTDAIARTLDREPRFQPGTRVDLSAHDPNHVASRYQQILDACISKAA